MHYENEELKKLQKKECSILKTIHEFCQENQIEYFIIGGTALGAVRHKDFIPWDDDIDIGMTRDNYERFLELSPDILGKDLRIVQRKHEPNCPFPYPKVRLKGTEFLECAHRDLRNITTGIYVDVFPFDKIPKDERLYREQFEAVQKLSKMYVFKKTKNFGYIPSTAKEKIKEIIKKFLYYLFKVVPDALILNKLHAEMTKYNHTDSDEYCCLFFPKLYTEYATVNTLYPLADYVFEDLIVKGPRDMDTYLKSHYGDYMKLPPEEDRVGHKPYRIKI